MDANTKYWVLAGLGIVMAVVTYLESQAAITEAVILAAVMIGVTMLFHDLEPTAPSPPATPATGA